MKWSPNQSEYAIIHGSEPKVTTTFYNKNHKTVHEFKTIYQSEISYNSQGNYILFNDFHNTCLVLYLVKMHLNVYKLRLEKFKSKKKVLSKKATYLKFNLFYFNLFIFPLNYYALILNKITQPSSSTVQIWNAKSKNI